MLLNVISICGIIATTKTILELIMADTVQTHKQATYSLNDNSNLSILKYKNITANTNPIVANSE